MHADAPHDISAPRLLRWPGLSEVWVRGSLSCRVLLLLRWLAVTGQALTLYAAWRMGVSLPWVPCAIAVGFTLVTNACLEWWLRQVNGEMDGGFFHVLLWDTGTLAFLLHWTGGLANPFSIFLLVHLTLAAVSLRTPAVAFLGACAMFVCLWLWQDSKPLLMREMTPVREELLAQGRAVALVLSGAFMLSMLLALRGRSHQLHTERARLRAELEARDRFVSIAALATGFAHELATPLGTIALAAEELGGSDDAHASKIIRRESARCRAVLEKLRSTGNEAEARSTPPCAVEGAIHDALQQLSEEQRQRVQTSLRAGTSRVAFPGMHEALLVMLRNALQATPDGPVRLEARCSRDEASITVRDHGRGFAPDMLRHWGEPFRSTRPPGEGLGLGLFFVRRAAILAGGRAEARNHEGGGACVTLVLPVHRNPGEAI